MLPFVVLGAKVHSPEQLLRQAEPDPRWSSMRPPNWYLRKGPKRVDRLPTTRRLRRRWCRGSLLWGAHLDSQGFARDARGELRQLLDGHRPNGDGQAVFVFIFVS
eukprot:scaffold8593_cov248-Pinguiococcus_pyrenoidosus.AAC.14